MKSCFRIFALLLCLSLLLSATACAEQAPTDGAIRFTDDTGVPISLAAAPTRVAVLFSSYVEIWQAAGGRVTITVGESVSRGLVASDTLLVDAGAGKTINTELLLSYTPDLVIGSCDIAAQREAAELLRSAGVPVALFRVEGFADYLRVLSVCAHITGNPDAVARYGTEQKLRIDALLATPTTSSPTVLFLRAGSTAKSTKAKNAEGHFAAAMLSEMGAVNIADRAPLLLDGISTEAVILQDPDAIFITTMGDEAAARAHMEEMLSSPAWQTLSAVREGRVYFLPKELFQYKPNARWADAYQMLWELLYDQTEPTPLA